MQSVSKESKKNSNKELKSKIKTTFFIVCVAIAVIITEGFVSGMSFYEASLFSINSTWAVRLSYVITYSISYFFLLALLIWFFYEEKLADYIMKIFSQKLHFIPFAIFLPIVMMILWTITLPGVLIIKKFSILKNLSLVGITLIEYGFMTTFIEEFTLRILLQSKIARVWGRSNAILSTSLFWALMDFDGFNTNSIHSAIWNTLVMTLWGILFSYIYDKTESFAECMLFHGMLNILWNGQILSIGTYFWNGNESIFEYKIPDLNSIFYWICNPEHYETNALVLLISFLAWKTYFYKKARKPSA